ncbi:mechanosensitive ion channel domain-containing protein [Solitalea koreensis]|uniref:Mechanosensitive ion channel n=1 Tax=Solitalea koreensis TaxID=543615 RepID=A0A521BIG4_9SPHI|nr:mechanosensitive ion channel domain-containing protein [Solitalea koreensis]SMO46885.1 Mechanosensitive ion channel [Solitalea koreensis]
MKSLIVSHFFLTFCAVFISLSVSAQQKVIIYKTHKIDTAKEDFVVRMNKIGKAEAKRNDSLYRARKTELKQDELMESIKKTTQKAKDYLALGIDTLEIDTELTRVKKWSKLAGEGVFTNKGTSQTYRNLASTSNILQVLQNKINSNKKKVDNYLKDLIDFRYQLDSLNSNSALYVFPADSALLIKYLQRLGVAAKEIGPTDSLLRQAMLNVQVLQTQLNLEMVNLNSGLDQIEMYQKEISDKAIDREYPDIWAPVKLNRPFKEIVDFSNSKNKLNLLFYTQDHLDEIIILFLLILASTLYLISLKKKYIQRQLLHANYNGQLVLRYPFLSAVVIVLNLFQFIFPTPPFVFNALFWIFSAIAITIIFHKFITKHWMQVWLLMFMLFLFACVNNLILQESRTERWGMLVLAGIGVLAGLFALLRNRRKELRERWVIYFIVFVIILETASIIFNIYGRYNFSKTLVTSGYFSFVIAILFFGTIRLINEGLSLASNIYTQQDNILHLDYKRIRAKAPALFYIGLIIGWFILFGRNFYAFKLITEPLLYFLILERKVGDYTFTINNLLSFVLILSISVIVSRVVSFFASEPNPSIDDEEREIKVGLGSWLLLIRIGIISIGMFLAIAAAGIPMDKVSIILGALGVGVGFGLQTLVNNLISGLIVAFEKPFNVGDVIEIAGQLGTMKSIGFRSSIIDTWNGGEVIMPNGDLLNAHLINWTLSDLKKRMEIMLGVLYGTDLEKTKQLLLDSINADERILKLPEPTVLFQDFGESSISIQVHFWVGNFNDGIILKSDMLMAIDKVLRENEIVISYTTPEQEDDNVFNEDEQKGENEDENLQ